MQNKYLNLLKYSVLFLIIFFALLQRVSYFNEIGRDVNTYNKALDQFIQGVNPYIWTVESFTGDHDSGSHGFAYLPGLLYIYSPLKIVDYITPIPFKYLWKFPNLLADIGIAVLLYKFFKKDFPALVTALFVWLFNPYIWDKHSYVYTDNIPVFFMMLSLYFLEKDDIKSGLLYSTAVAMKTFPILFFPVMIILSRNKIKFIISCLLVGLFFSIPFLTNIRDFLTYLQGSLFVHGDRIVQGRPFIFNISYNYKIELFQIIPLKVYTSIATFSGWFLTLFLYFKFKIKDKYLLALLTFIPFYLFSPVLNRTYLIWFLPLLIISTYQHSKGKYWWLFYLIMVSYWFFYYWYLVPWQDGYDIKKPL